MPDHITSIGSKVCCPGLADPASIDVPIDGCRIGELGIENGRGALSVFKCAIDDIQAFHFDGALNSGRVAVRIDIGYEQ